MTTLSPTFPKIFASFAGGITLLLAGLAAAPAAFAAPELSVYINGPEKLQVGLSGTYNVAATNDGDVSAPAEVFIIFAGKLDQTDQVTASGWPRLRNPSRCRHQRGGSLHDPATSAENRFQHRGAGSGIGAWHRPVGRENQWGSVPPRGRLR